MNQELIGVQVTPYFTPNNGGDSGVFPRREAVRSWKESERSIVGIGGGTLKFKSWTKGTLDERCIDRGLYHTQTMNSTDYIRSTI